MPSHAPTAAPRVLPDPSAPPRAEPDDSLRASLPLLATASVLFVGAILAWYRRIVVGSAKFPLADLLIALATVAAVGAVVLWFFAGEPISQPRPVRDSAATAGEPAPPVAEGRPRPDVRAASLFAIPALTRDRRARPRRDPHERPREARVEAETQDRVDRDLRSALQELDGIQHELVARQAPSSEVRRPRAKASRAHRQ